MPREIVAPGKHVSGVDEMIGAGPFRAVSYVPESDLELTGFDEYWKGPPTVRKLTMRVVKDASTRLEMLRQNKLDWAGLPHADVAAFKADPAFNVIEADRAAIFYVGMNGHIYKPFSDRRVRQAFNHAIDRERIVNDVLGGVGRPALGILPPSVPHQERSLPTLGYDPAKAKSLLREAGWEGKLPPLELWMSDPTGDRRRAAELVVSMLRENLGVEASLKQVESGVLIQRATKREVAFFMGSWYMDYLDPENLLSVLLSSYGQNRTNYDNPRFSELCRKADAMAEGPERLRLYAEAEDLAIQDATWIPLYHPREAVAVHRQVTGLDSNPFGLLPPVHVSRE
jgi:ABC-type transport system substrate-binding protein